MTALNCYVDRNAAHMFTDGAFYDLKNMRKVGEGNKVAVLPRWNAVIGATGVHFLSHLIDGHSIEQPFATFDELAANFAQFLKRMLEAQRKAIEAVPANTPLIPPDWGQFECVLAGWSESKDAPTAFLVREFAHQGVPAFSAVEIERHYSPMAPNMEHHYWKPHDIAGSGLELLRAQHKMKFAVRSGGHDERKKVPGSFMGEDPKTFNVVGGFAQHTRVDRDGITIRVLERWND